MCRRVATALAVMSVLAFAIDGALGGSHLVPAASAHVGHVHAHAHSQADAHGHAPGVSDHQIVSNDVVTVTADHHASFPTSAPDADANCCSACACCAAVLLPSSNGQSAPFLVAQTLALAHRRHGDGFVPEGLRRPPRPLSIA
ncbi:MAG: hypothetical protein K2Y71_20850 [Xanthobacteraceae bacterium]|nr:hypothetical protein [Xanthobacteraceae bacterium]